MVRKVKTRIFIILLVSTFSFHCFSQHTLVVGDTKPYKHLIGMDYFDTSELGDFIWKSSGTTTDEKGKKLGHTSLHAGEQHIITSEFIEEDSLSFKDIRRIVDIIVLNEHIRNCYGCLLPNKKNTQIMTIHSWGDKQMSENSILAAFEINQKTGKFKELNPAKYKWKDNTNLDLFK